jgi:hypothetical protein
MFEAARKKARKYNGASAPPGTQNRPCLFGKAGYGFERGKVEAVRKNLGDFVKRRIDIMRMIA